MKLTILGCGTYQPVPDRGTPSYLVQVKDKNIVLDFGMGCINNLMKAGLHYYDIDDIFISHTHADHFAEIGFFLHIALAEIPWDRHMHKDLTIYGPKGIKKAIKGLLEIYFGDSDRPKTDYFKFEVVELAPGDIVRKKDYSVKACSTNHSKRVECLAFRLDADNKVLSYSGDSGDCEGLREACQNADAAIIETSWPDEIQTEEHLHGSEAGKLCQECKVKKMICVHIAAEYSKKHDVAADVRRFFKGEVVVGKDLMSLVI